MDFKVDVEKHSATPIYAQLRDQIRLAIHRGALGTGQAMPTVRALAVELGINANTVARVYRDLQVEGLLRLERGVGTFVTDGGRDRAVGEDAFEAIAAKARELVGLSREAGLRAGEVAQLIETLWKEKTDAET
jgi:GntR family transcriptional regulator